MLGQFGIGLMDRVTWIMPDLNSRTAVAVKANRKKSVRITGGKAGHRP